MRGRELKLENVPSLITRGKLAPVQGHELKRWSRG